MIESENKKYIIDLEEHKLSFIFPLMNWFVPKKAKQLSDEEVSDLSLVKILSKEEKIKNLKIGLGTGGTGMLLQRILTKYTDDFSLNNNNILFYMSTCILLLLVFVVRVYMSRKMSCKSIALKEYDCKIIVFPKPAHIFYMLLIFLIIIGTLYVAVTILFVDRNFLYLLVLAMFVFIYTLLNIFCILPGRAHIKIKHIRK